MGNRRLAPRYDLTLAVVYRGVAASGRGSVISLSEGGCALQANTPFPPREPLTLLISVGLGAPLVTIATVRWSDGLRCGVEFVS